MAVRYLVEDTFPRMTGGPRILGLLLEGVVRGGETLAVEETVTPGSTLVSPTES